MRPKGVALPLGGPVLRVWLPSRRRQSFDSSKVCFNLQHSWAFPFRAFLRSSELFDVSLEHDALALFIKTVPGLEAVLQRVLLTRQPCS
jgi:hypothetical protein